MLMHAERRYFRADHQHAVAEALRALDAAKACFSVPVGTEVAAEIQAAIIYACWLLVDVVSDEESHVLYVGSYQGRPYELRLHPHIRVPAIWLIDRSSVASKFCPVEPASIHPDEFILEDGHGPAPAVMMDGHRARAAVFGLVELLVRDAAHLADSDFDDPDDVEPKETSPDEEWHPDRMLERACALRDEVQALMMGTEVLSS